MVRKQAYASNQIMISFFSLRADLDLRFNQDMFLLNSILMTLHATAMAVPVEYQVNAREGCRQAIAGSYVEAHDEYQRALAYLENVTEQVKELKAAAIKADKDAKAAAAKMAGKSYDIDTASNNDMAASSSRAIHQQLTEYLKLQSQAERDVVPTRQREQTLKDQLSKVFVIEQINDPPRGGYPFRVVYRTACPKYRALCPLPATEQDALAKFKIDGDLPESCRKYLGQSKIRQ